MSELRRRLLMSQGSEIDLSLPYIWLRGRGNEETVLLKKFFYIEKVLLIDLGIEIKPTSYSVVYTYGDTKLHPIQYVFRDLDRIDGFGNYLFDSVKSPVEYVGDFMKGYDFYNFTTATYVFNGLESLRAVYKYLFADLPKIKTFYNTFSYCRNLENTPVDYDGRQLWEREGQPGYPTTIDGRFCFQYCLNLPNYNDIPSSWK